MRGWLVLVLLAAVAAAGAFAWPRLESDPPRLEAPAELAIGAGGSTVHLRMSDVGRGLRSVSVRLLTRGGARDLRDEQFPGSAMTGSPLPGEARELELQLDPELLGIPDGPASLVVSVRDWSWREAFAGNRSESRIELTVDTRAPSLEVESGLTYAYRGGAGALTYRVRDDGGAVARHGVQVGRYFFAGAPLGTTPPGDAAPADGALRAAAVFAVPVDADREAPVEVVAFDAAGNRAAAVAPVKVTERRFARTKISLSGPFIDRVVPRLKDRLETPPQPGGAFDAINTRLRQENEARIREVIAAASSPRALWQGAFQQMPSSQVTSRFAERRSYLLDGVEISKAIHYGFDLASTSQAPVTASNRGVVRFAEDLGIYGNCVIIDHGRGVHSLYGHLSQIAAKVGQEVAKGQEIGRSGDTGLAGGDHLHFAILVGDAYVDPLEWWDPKWIRTHVDVRLQGGER